PASAVGWRLPVLAIHSPDDQVVPFDPAAARIAELQNAGVNAKLIPAMGLAHYEVGRFREPLRQAIPWLREVWKEACTALLAGCARAPPPTLMVRPIPLVPSFP